MHQNTESITEKRYFLVVFVAETFDGVENVLWPRIEKLLHA
jgi:hypothetical protein